MKAATILAELELPAAVTGDGDEPPPIDPLAFMGFVSRVIDELEHSSPLAFTVWKQCAARVAAREQEGTRG
jgi:hypothetical protein